MQLLRTRNCTQPGLAATSCCRCGMLCPMWKSGGRRATASLGPKKSGSQRTRRWREVDSNHRSRHFEAAVLGLASSFTWRAAVRSSGGQFPGRIRPSAQMLILPRRRTGSARAGCRSGRWSSRTPGGLFGRTHVPDAGGGERQLDRRRSERDQGVGDGVGHQAADRDDRALAGALDAERVAR